MLISGNEFIERTREGVVLVDFFATWCGPCRMLAPVLDDVEKTLKGKAQVFKLDVDESEDIAKDFGVMSIPTMVILKDGVEVDRLIGLKSEDKIIEAVEKQL